MLNINRPFTTEDITLVTVENLYYWIANATATPALCEAYSEHLDDYVIGRHNYYRLASMHVYASK